jgi:hypothetical protein
MTSISSTRGVRKEGLQHLYKQLHQNKAQLSELTGISNHIQYIIDLALQKMCHLSSLEHKNSNNQIQI